MKVERLIIGAEHRQKPGWTHHDIQPLLGIDVVCDYYDLPDHVTPKFVKEIEITHVLEHFPIADIQKTLGVLHTLLRPGGEVYIEVPNFAWHAREILRDPLNRQIIEYAFGGQRNQWDYHYNGFTPQILTDDLLTAGFGIREIRPNSSIECRAVRL